jgi:hypothetical protein
MHEERDPFIGAASWGGTGQLERAAARAAMLGVHAWSRVQRGHSVTGHGVEATWRRSLSWSCCRTSYLLSWAGGAVT